MLPRWLIPFRAFSLACAFAAAFVPIATYITDDKRDWLWIHIGVNIAAYIAVALTTIHTTVSLTQQDHNKFSVPAYWANNVVMRTWYLGVSKTWRWHVAAAVGRLGLALALAQHLQIVTLYGPEAYRASQFQGILSPFYYVSYNTLIGNEHLTAALPVNWETSLLGFFTLCSFALLEAGLLAAFTVAFSKIKRDLTVVLTIGLRGALIGGIVLGMTLARNLVKRERLYCNCSPLFHEWHQIAFTWLDNGTALSAWMMRPISILNFYADVYTSAVSAFIALIAYIFAIGFSLQFAQYLHWRQEQRESSTPSSTP